LREPIIVFGLAVTVQKNDEFAFHHPAYGMFLAVVALSGKMQGFDIGEMLGEDWSGDIAWRRINDDDVNIRSAACNAVNFLHRTQERSFALTLGKVVSLGDQGDRW